MIDDLDYTIRKYLKKYNVRCRDISIDEDANKVILSIEDTKDNQLRLLKDLRHLGLRPQSIIYGRWSFIVQ